MTCMSDVENPRIDIASYNRAMFAKYVQTPMSEAIEELQKKFPDVAKRLSECREIDFVREINIRFEVFECGLRNPPAS
jgi:uncharacterized protein (DUF2461 family)